MHLSLSKGVVKGTKEQELKEYEPPDVTLVMDQKMVLDTMQSMLLKEAKPVNEVSYQGKCLTPPLDTSAEICVLGVGSKYKSYMLTGVPRPEPEHEHNQGQGDAETMSSIFSISKENFSDFQTYLLFGYTDIMHLFLPRNFDPGIKELEVHNHQDQRLQRRQQPKISCPKKNIILQLVEAIKVSMELSHSGYNFSNTDIMHLLFVQKVENFSGCKEEIFKEIPLDNLMLLREPNTRKVKNVATQTLKDHTLQKRCNDHKHSRGVILSYLSKEEPPDAPCITKPKLYHQGKVLNSQKRMKPDLLYCGATGYPVLRSKPLQEGGDDVVIKPVAEPEVNPTTYQTSQGANQDICALKMPYLTNQEGFNHEANFYGFYTQEGVQPNWNRSKIPTEQEVMDFTKWRFSSPSIREYPTLEGDSGPKKGRSEPKPNMGFKRSLSSFHQAQYQEKWSRKSGDMINLPEPVKPVLHLPQLGANRFNQLQTRHWRPGDHFNQSGGVPEVLSYTRTQEISWFNGESLKSNRSYLWKDWTIFRFDHFPAIPIRPEDIQAKPRHPGDIIGIQEELYTFIPCTSHHWIRRIHIYSKLPYLEILAFKLQQLFFLESMHAISTFQAINKIPRKLTYPLKPSRYKEKLFYIYLAKILTIKPPTASFKEPSIPLLPRLLFRIYLFPLVNFRLLECPKVEPI